MAQGKWDMIDVLGYELIRSNTTTDLLVLEPQRLVVAPASLTRKTAADLFSQWWVREPRQSRQ